jgi:hypothetical protein
MKYKIIADVNSDYKDRLKSYKNCLTEKQKEKTNYVVSEWDPDTYMTEEEVDAYNAGWCLAFAVAECNLEMWFPELKKEN